MIGWLRSCMSKQLLRTNELFIAYHIKLVVGRLCQHNHGSQIRTRSIHVLSTTIMVYSSWLGARGGWDNLWALALRNSLDDMHSILQFAPWLPLIISVAARVGNQSPFNVNSEMYFLVWKACVCVGWNVAISKTLRTLTPCSALGERFSHINWCVWSCLRVVRMRNLEFHCEASNSCIWGWTHLRGNGPGHVASGDSQWAIEFCYEVL